MTLFERENLYARLTAEGHGAWAGELRLKTQDALLHDRHGNLGAWIDVWNQLPTAKNSRILADRDAVTIEGDVATENRSSL